MSRALQTGDFIPDFVFSNARQTLHSAAMGGQKWILAIAPNHSVARKSAHIQEFLRGGPQGDLTVFMVALSGSKQEHEGLAECEHVHAADKNHLEELIFPAGQQNDNLCVLVIDHCQKIVERLDLSPIEAGVALPGLIEKHLKEMNALESGAMPVLKVPSALPKDFCQSLIKWHKESDQKQQGRAGLSAPRLDMSIKRVVHVNASRELGQEIDRVLVFSLLPAIERVFDYRVTHRVAYKISAYSAEQKGFFAAHRDNSDTGTTFRRFALSICLNEDWRGGGICFPEYSSAPLHLATGDALVFPTSLMHRVEPIQQGERLVLLSFMYDKEGALSRRAAMENPSILDTKYVDAIDEEILRAYRLFSPNSRFSPQYSRS